MYFVGGGIDRLFFPEQLPTPTFGTGGLVWASLTLALLTVPVVIVSAASAVYFRLGRDAKYDLLYSQAQQPGPQTAAQLAQASRQRRSQAVQALAESAPGALWAGGGSPGARILAAWSLLAPGNAVGAVEPNDFVRIDVPYSSLFVAVHVPTNQVLDAELVVYAYSVRERERGRTRVLAHTRTRPSVSLTGYSSYNQPISIENEDVFPDLQMSILRDLDLPKLPKIPKIKLPDGPIKLPDVLKKLPITDEIKRRTQLELTKRLPPGLKPGTIGDRVRKLRKRVDSRR